MALNDLMKPTTSGCSSFVLILAVAIPLLLFWGPLRELINDYRIYRQVQKYPHIVVYKNNSRKGYNRISGVAVLIGRLSLKALITLFGFVKYSFLALLTSVFAKIYSITMASVVNPPVEEKGNEDDVTMISSDIGNQESTVSERSHHLTLPASSVNHQKRLHKAPMAHQKPTVQRQAEGIFESRSKSTNTIEVETRRQQYSIAPEPQTEYRLGETNPSRSSIIRVQSQKTEVMPTTIALRKSICIDSSSLSEKMRKRRLDGGNMIGYDSVSEHGDGDISRKKRRLNNRRIPLKGCVTRLPTAVPWQTTKMLKKREKEEREERILRGMSRKRSKPTIEISKPINPTPTLTAPAGPSFPTFNVGQTNTQATTSPAAMKQKSGIQAADSTTIPAFNFGTNGDSKSNPSNAENATVKPPVTSFGNTSSVTSNQNKATSGPVPTAPTQAPPVFGAGNQTSTVNSATANPVAQAPSFGTTHTATTQAPATSGSVAQNFPTFGGTATNTSATPKPSTAPPAFTFGASTAQATAPAGNQPTATTASTYQSVSQGGSQPAKPANTQQVPFGNTKENTNPVSFNSTSQASVPFKGFSKPQATNGNFIPPLGTNGGYSAGAGNSTPLPSFGNSNAGGMPGFSVGNRSAVAPGGAAARRQARKARNRRR